MLPSFFNWEVTVIRPATKLERGSTVDDWDHAIETNISGCSVQPSATNLNQGEHELATKISLVLYMPTTADVQPSDRIKVGGDIFVIDGEVMLWRSPTGNLSHKHVNLVRWNG